MPNQPVIVKFQTEKKYLLYLLYLYGFLVTLEHVLQELYGVATIFKPYRVVGLAIIALVFLNKKGFIFFHKENRDWYLTSFVLFSGLLTVLYIAFGKDINVPGFLNFYTQIVFNLLIFLALKRINIDQRNLVTLLKFYSAGIIVNAVVMIRDYYFGGGETRVSGFMDNPNSGSFSIMVAILFFILLLSRNHFSPIRISSWIYLSLLIFLGLAVFAAGSRTGIVLSAVGVVLNVGFGVNTKNFVRLAALVIFAYATFSIYLSVNDEPLKRLGGKISSSRFFYKMNETEDDIRVFLWRGGFDAFVDSGFMGIGVAQFSSNMYYFKTYMSPYLPQYVRDREIHKKGGLGLHNMYIDVLVESGVVALVLLLLYFFKVVAHRMRSLKSSSRDVNAFLLTISIVMLLTSLTGYGLLSGAFWFVMFITSKSYPLLVSSKRETMFRFSPTI